MTNVKEIKRRILSMDNVIKTTEAMKMISTLKLKKVKELLHHVQTYLNDMQLIFSNFSSTLDIYFYKKTCRYFFHKNRSKSLLIFITSNRGLCGSFNSLIFEKVNQLIKEKNGKKYVLFSIGKKGNEFILNNKFHRAKIHHFSFENYDLFFQDLTKLFFNRFDSIYFIYNKLQTSMHVETIVEKILPISIQQFPYQKNQIPPILGSSKKKIINFLIEKLLILKCKKFFLHSSSSEHTERMISMHKASENAKDIKENLIINYNKERQYLITKEILEIVGGLESLK
ncbi:F0F1 ATP synthase subunit gamma [Blattabacterium cuenoti]|uniref:F0F1 ATP synthase subunit gamma n=1 Tax=Blattabacterium cuenoti TaxID=1653831 RepID=UPI00163B80A2|nr:FoF1 ATP synthase subunit gamma [Blattabacterium cuenoti]